MAKPASAEDVRFLKELAKLGALHDHVTTSSSELASRIGTSQQTASRKILELLDAGLIVRRMGTRKQLIRLSPTGVEALRQEHADYRALFSSGERIVLRGKVVTGLGEGRYYISREGYRKAFSALLGFDPYAGTLNVEVEPLEREKVAELKELPGLMIQEFKSEGRTFGAVKCFRAQIATQGETAECAAIFPLRSHHVHVVELISPFQLRERLKLKDGADVRVTLELASSSSESRAQKL